MRHINVELKLPWYKMMMARERDKLKHLGEQEYAMQHMESVRSNIRYWVADFTRWCLEIARPSASCNKVYGKSSFRLVQNLRAKTMYWKTLFIVNAPSLYRRQFKPFQPNCVARDLLKENPFVPLVSALEPKPENVRDTQEVWKNPLNHETETLGCWCFMPIKSWLRVNCWAWEHGLQIGWADELNSDYERK